MTDRGSDSKPFLSRWSQRKQAVRAEEEGLGGAPEPKEGSAAPQTASQEELDANRAAAEAIELETLTDTSDYAPFFRPGVPAVLKSAALKKLWRSNPVFAVLDGLNDYDESYAWPTSGSEVVRSAWKLGRGFLSGDDEAAAEERAAAKPAEGGPAVHRQPQADEPSAKTEETSPEAEHEVAAAADEGGAEPRAAGPSKVSLTRRLDIAAFAKEKGEE
jgi:hypothetical protein